MIFRRPLIPVLPLIAAAPAKHHQDSLFIRETKEAIRLQLSFKPDGVQMHIFDQPELLLQPSAILTQQHILRPSCASNENGFAVHFEESEPLIRQFRCNLTNAKAD